MTKNEIKKAVLSSPEYIKNGKCLQFDTEALGVMTIYIM